MKITQNKRLRIVAPIVLALVVVMGAGYVMRSESQHEFVHELDVHLTSAQKPFSFKVDTVQTEGVLSESIEGETYATSGSIGSDAFYITSTVDNQANRYAIRTYKVAEPNETVELVSRTEVSSQQLIAETHAYDPQKPSPSAQFIYAPLSIKGSNEFKIFMITKTGAITEVYANTDQQVRYEGGFVNIVHQTFIFNEQPYEGSTSSGPVRYRLIDFSNTTKPAMRDFDPGVDEADGLVLLRSSRDNTKYLFKVVAHDSKKTPPQLLYSDALKGTEKELSLNVEGVGTLDTSMELFRESVQIGNDVAVATIVNYDHPTSSAMSARYGNVIDLETGDVTAQYKVSDIPKIRQDYSRDIKLSSTVPGKLVFQSAVEYQAGVTGVKLEYIDLFERTRTSLAGVPDRLVAIDVTFLSPTTVAFGVPVTQSGAQKFRGSIYDTETQTVEVTESYQIL